MNLFKNREKGQGLVEYALLLVLVAVVVIGILMLLGPQINSVFMRVNAALSGSMITSAKVVSVTGPDAGDKYTITVQVEVLESTSVTFTPNPQTTFDDDTCDPGTTCTLSARSSAASGTFTLTDSNGKSFTGSFP